MKIQISALLLCAATAVNADVLDTYNDTWVCADELGRNVAYAGKGVTRTKIDSTLQIGMFYYIWHGQHGEEIKDITRLLENNAENPKWGAVGQFHWGGKPVLGYYKGGDRYIIARHMQMLMDAGVDFYFFDVTNAFTYDSNVKAVMAEVDRRTRLGLKVPKLAFMTHSSTASTVQHLYDTFYKDKRYDKYWFMWEGKPLILVEQAEFKTLSQEVRDRFTYRHSWAWDTGENKWSWLANYPQAVGYAYDKNHKRVNEQMSVSVAQHPSSKIGKSYHGGKQPPYDKYGLCKGTPYGYYFDEQWKRAVNARPKVVMVTQWNEWMAQRFLINSANEFSLVRPGATAKVGETYFVDVYNQEFSRDIEPSSEPLIRDNYYLQMVSYSRKYKGARPIPIPTVSKSITIDDDFSQWDNVTPEFIDEPGDTYYKSSTAQSSESLRRKTNDIVSAKVTKDADSLYFYVATAANICSPTAATRVRWMSLLLNVDCVYSNGWNGYDYMVSNDGDVMKLYRYDDAWNEGKEVKMRRQGNKLMLSLAKKDVGMTDEADFDFKWIDNISKASTDILDFIKDGDVAPNGRFNYRFRGSQLASVPTAIKGIASNNADIRILSSDGKITLGMQLPQGCDVHINIYNVQGKKVATKRVQHASAGAFSMAFDLMPGNYIAKIKMGNRTCVRKFSNLKGIVNHTQE